MKLKSMPNIKHTVHYYYKKSNSSSQIGCWTYLVICVLIIQQDVKQYVPNNFIPSYYQQCRHQANSNSSLQQSQQQQQQLQTTVCSNKHDTTNCNYYSQINFGLGAYAFDELERVELRDEARQMFYHAYNSYLSTYPADEILPISCQGRYRQGQGNSEIDDSIGNFSLTLVDSLDTLVMLGDFDEFEVALRKVIEDLNFDTDIVVSVFETNIRMLGGLLSAHILAKSIQNHSDRNIRNISNATRSKLDWYNSEILDLAEDLGNRLLPAFSTKTGIPHPRVNLKHGMEFKSQKPMHETCTACAGSLILEFATLSRLTGKPIFEQKARKALDSIWNHRHKSTDLVGTVLNVDSGEWVRRESGVGAGSDSYYEYLLKAYILLGDQTYLDRFNKHYRSVMHYISHGPFLIDVHMHRPNRIAKYFMDALSAFWPGLQVLKGDLRSAVETHTMFSEVIRRHSYLPEAFTTDLEVHWAHHQMRPEFLESTYFLYRATKDDFYLEIGRDILRKLQRLKVDCGYAGLKDVRTGVHDDKMASFVLAETFKYLYLLFSAENETSIDLDRFIFSTEGHLLPIDLSLTKLLSNDNDDDGDDDIDKKKTKDVFDDEDDDEEEVQHVEGALQRAKLDVEQFLARLFADTLDDESNSIDKKNVIKPLEESTESKKLLKKREEKVERGKKRNGARREKSVIEQLFGDNSDTCPSLEALTLRFNGRYHPFLNKDLNNLENNDGGSSIYHYVDDNNNHDNSRRVFKMDSKSVIKFLQNGAIRLTFASRDQPNSEPKPAPPTNVNAKVE